MTTNGQAQDDFPAREKSILSLSKGVEHLSLSKGVGLTKSSSFDKLRMTTNGKLRVTINGELRMTCRLARKAS